jgi:hypothetical protein
MKRSFYTPKQTIPAGTATVPQPSGKSITKLFQPLKLRALTLQNRIIVSPMCQYSADNGKLTDWHLAHLGGIISRGPGLTIIESTAVVAEGRITPEDSGLWEDSQIAPLRKITDFAHSQGQYIAIQLNHAGRKSSTVAPWIDRKAAAPAAAGGWPDNISSVSDVPYDDNLYAPQTLTLDGIATIKAAFAAAAQRAVLAGIDVSYYEQCEPFTNTDCSRLLKFMQPTATFSTLSCHRQRIPSQHHMADHQKIVIVFCLKLWRRLVLLSLQQCRFWFGSQVGIG